MDTSKLEQKLIRQWAKTHNTSEAIAKAIIKLSKSWQDADLKCYAPKRIEYETVLQDASLVEDCIQWDLSHDRRTYSDSPSISCK